MTNYARIQLAREAVEPIVLDAANVHEGMYFTLGGCLFLRPTDPAMGGCIPAICLNDGSRAWLPVATQVTIVFPNIAYGELDGWQE